jgi:hypothetical protein
MNDIDKDKLPKLSEVIGRGEITFSEFVRSDNKIDPFEDFKPLWTNSNEDNDCLHKQCERCNGTGVDKVTKQSCIHFISCPCKRCTPRC